MDSQFFNNREQQFFEAISHGNISKMLELLKSGVSIAAKAPFGGKQALHVACEAKQKVVVEKLIELGANVNATTDRGFTPLHVAALQNDKDILLMLIRAGADINAVTDNGMGTTPLMEAATKGHLVATNVLLAAGANVQYRERQLNLTAANLANRAGHSDILAALLGYKRAFIVRVEAILKSWDVFSKNSPEENYYLQLKNIPLDIVDIDADEYFMQLRTRLAEGYQEVKEKVQVLRGAIINAMKQYNADKTLENEVKQALLSNTSPQAAFR